MRSPGEQEDFLERGRFGEGESSVPAVQIPTLAKIGLVLIGIGCACIGVIVIFQIGRDDGGPFLVMGSILCGIMGVGCCLGSWVRGLVGKRTR
jgi:hypothetical protein